MKSDHDNAMVLLDQLDTAMNDAQVSLRPWLDDPLNREENYTLRAVIENMKRIVIQIKDRTLSSSLENWVERFKVRHRSMGVEVSYSELGLKFDLPLKIQNELSCVFQEACSNALKHGDAKTIKVLMIYKEGHLQVSISDNGSGMDIDKILEDGMITSNGGAGIGNMTSRVQKLGGKIQFFSKDYLPGTILLIDIPISGYEENDFYSEEIHLGNELHDYLCPELIGSALIVANTKRFLTSDESEKWYQIKCLQEVISDFAKQLRTISHQMIT